MSGFWRLFQLLSPSRVHWQSFHFWQLSVSYFLTVISYQLICSSVAYLIHTQQVFDCLPGIIWLMKLADYLYLVNLLFSQFILNHISAATSVNNAPNYLTTNLDIWISNFNISIFQGLQRLANQILKRHSPRTEAHNSLQPIDAISSHRLLLVIIGSYRWVSARKM